MVPVQDLQKWAADYRGPIMQMISYFGDCEAKGTSRSYLSTGVNMQVIMDFPETLGRQWWFISPSGADGGLSNDIESKTRIVDCSRATMTRNGAPLGGFK